jgi:hypothetical protein
MTGPGEFDYLLKDVKSKSIHSPPESRVMAEESRVRNLVPIVEIAPRESSLDSRIETAESRVKGIDYAVLEEAIEEANNKPKLGVYSPLAAAVLRYKAIKTPRYSMGSELRCIIEQALKETYPELYEEIQERMEGDKASR